MATNFPPYFALTAVRHANSVTATALIGWVLLYAPPVGFVLDLLYVFPDMIPTRLGCHIYSEQMVGEQRPPLSTQRK